MLKLIESSIYRTSIYKVLSHLYPPISNQWREICRVISESVQNSASCIDRLPSPIFLAQFDFSNGTIKDYAHRVPRDKTSQSIFILAMLAKRQLLTSASITCILTFSRIIFRPRNFNILPYRSLETKINTLVAIRSSNVNKILPARSVWRWGEQFLYVFKQN